MVERKIAILRPQVHSLPFPSGSSNLYMYEAIIVTCDWKYMSNVQWNSKHKFVFWQKQKIENGQIYVTDCLALNGATSVPMSFLCYLLDKGSNSGLVF